MHKHLSADVFYKTKYHFKTNNVYIVDNLMYIVANLNVNVSLVIIDFY